jgi:hypothetical protein
MHDAWNKKMKNVIIYHAEEVMAIKLHVLTNSLRLQPHSTSSSIYEIVGTWESSK